jgi:hypothetical protein
MLALKYGKRYFCKYLTTSSGNEKFIMRDYSIIQQPEWRNMILTAGVEV